MKRLVGLFLLGFLGVNIFAQGSMNVCEYVDLGLSVKWATCNVGATYPEESGDWFAWGEIHPKTLYSEHNSVTYKKRIADIKGDYKYDAAYAKWGERWRMPTKAEFEELINMCRWEWTKKSNVYGYNVVGPNGNNIFLPAAGYRERDELNYWGEVGTYWTSSPFENHLGALMAAELYFDDENRLYLNNHFRYSGRSIRAVID